MGEEREEEGVGEGGGGERGSRGGEREREGVACTDLRCEHQDIHLVLLCHQTLLLLGGVWERDQVNCLLTVYIHCFPV